MMSKLFSQLFKIEHFNSQVEREQALIIYGFSVLVGIFTLIGLLTFPSADGGLAIANAIASGNYLGLIAPLILLAICAINPILVRQRQLTLASVLLMGLILLSLAVGASDGEVQGFEYIAYTLVVIMGALLFHLRGYLLFSILTASLFFAGELWEIYNEAAQFPIIEIITFLATIGVGILFIRSIRASRAEGQTHEGLERLKLAEINSQITQQASSRMKLAEALDNTLNLILRDYPQFYHAQVFLLTDDGIQARLSASTGEVGKLLMEKAHGLAVGSLSVIGQTTFKSEPVIARAGIENSVHRQNQLLPDTKLEAAFPLKIGTRVIGALDLQSRDDLKLSPYDILTFESLASSLSLAIDSIRQFEAAQARIEENQRLNEQTRAALREVERLNQRLIGRAWSEFLTSKGNQVGLNIDFDTEESVQAARWTSTLAEAAQSNNIVQDGRVIAVPLRVRGQVIGAMEFELGDDGEFSPEDFELLQEVSDRFGLAAENTRLIEESQRVAQRETLINEISSRLQSANNVEATLAEAARSLSETLKADKVMIRLGLPKNDPARAMNNRSK